MTDRTPRTLDADTLAEAVARLAVAYNGRPAGSPTVLADADALAVLFDALGIATDDAPAYGPPAPGYRNRRGMTAAERAAVLATGASLPPDAVMVADNAGRVAFYAPAGNGYASALAGDAANAAAGALWDVWRARGDAIDNAGRVLAAMAGA